MHSRNVEEMVRVSPPGMSVSSSSRSTLAPLGNPLGVLFSPPTESHPSYKKGIYWSAWMTLMIGFLGLVGWMANIPFLAQVHPLSVLLSLRGSLIFFTLGAVFLLYFNHPRSGWALALLFLTGAGTLLMAYYDDRTFPWVDELLMPVLVQNLNSWEYVYRDRMAPVTASGFLLFGALLTLFPLTKRFRPIADISGSLGALYLLAHVVLLMGFTYGVPFKDPRGYKPISFLGCIGSITLCISYLGALGTGAFPFRFFSGKSIRAILWRTFVPVGAASIFVYALLDHTVFARMNLAVSAMLAMFLATLIVSLLVMKSTAKASYSIEESLRESENRFSLLVQSLRGHAIYMVDPQGRVLTWNRGSEKLQGFRGEDVLGENFAQLFGEEESQREVPSELLLQAASRGMASTVAWHRRSDGTRFWAEDVASAIYDDQQRINGYALVTRDISIRRQAEELQQEKAVSTEMLQFVSNLTNEASELQDTIQKTLIQICHRLHLPVGHVWEVNEENDMLTSYYWYTEPGNEWKTFRAAAERPMQRANEELPGLALHRKGLVLLHSFSAQAGARAVAARQADLSSAFAFPVGVGDRVSFVFEFFAKKNQVVSSGLQHTLEQIGIQLGHWAERRRAMETLTTSLREKEILLKEIHHRVKNNLQIISSLFRLQSDKIEDPRILNKFRESQDRVKSMALIHEYLYRSTDIECIPMMDYLQTLVSNLFRSYGANPTEIVPSYRIGKEKLNLNLAVPCGLIVTELVSNVLKYAFPGQKQGHLEIGLRETAPCEYELSVQDDGVGLPAEFTLEGIPSLGLRLVQALTRQVDGELRWETLKPGTRFVITMKHEENEGGRT